jgi:hypothetical protein
MIRRIRTISFDSAVFDGRGFDARYSTDTGVELRMRSELAGIEPGAFATIDTDRYAKLWGLASFGKFFTPLLPVRLEVKALSLEPEEEELWRSWFRGILSEIFFKLGLSAELELNFSGERLAPRQDAPRLSDSAILLSGGGKDSIVAAELLKRIDVGFRWYSVEAGAFTAVRELAKLCGDFPMTTSSWFLEIQGSSGFKRFDPNRLRQFHFWQKKRLQRIIYWPSLMSPAIEACLLGEAVGSRHILIGTERSANEGNGIWVGDLEVNHQYTKCYSFEREFAAFIAKYLHPDLRYAGLLMPFYELQIGKMLAAHPQYFSAIKSCNRRVKGRNWCLTCPKCAFVFLIMSAFVDKEAVARMFGADLLTEPSLVQTFVDLCGGGDHKPLECVGVTDESLLALHLAAQRRTAEPLHRDLQAILPAADKAEVLRERILGAYNEKNGLPAAWNEQLRALVP